MIVCACRNDGVDMILMLYGFAERFEDQSSNSLSGNKTVIASAIAMTFSIERKHASLAEGLVFRGM